MAKDKVVIDIVAKDDTKKGIKKAESSFKGLAKTLGPLIAAGFGVAAVKTVTDAYIRQEDAIAQLDARLKSTGNTVGFTSKQLQNFASELQGVTKFGDEAVIEMQSLLLTFTQIGGETFNKATEAILNVSTAMGQDLQSAAIQVGKALNDPILGVTALQRSGIQFTESQKDMIKTLVKSGDTIGAQTIILKELETQFGGAARAAKDTLGGALQTAENDVGDLAESIGGILAPTIAEFADLASFAARALREMIDPTLKGDIADINQELQALDGLLDSLISEGVAENQIAFVEGQIDELIAKRLELETKLAEINEPTAKRGEATTTAGVPGLSDKDSLAAGAAFLEEQLAIELFFLERGEQQEKDSLEARQALRDLDVAAAKQAADMKSQNEENAAKAGMKALTDLGSLMNSESRKAFEIGKTAAIASTLIKTYQSATSSFNAIVETVPGPAGIALGVAAAAAAVSAGLANVQSISSQQFGGGGGGSPSVPNIPSSGIGPQAPTVVQPTSTITELGGAPIEVRTGSILGVWVQEELAPALVEAQRLGVTIVVT